MTDELTDSELTVDVPEHQLRALLHGDKDTVRVPESAKAPNTTPISDVKMNETFDLMGVVRQVNDINHFDRDDGGQGQVRNIRIQDRTGDIRCALWGEHADLALDIGDYVHILNADVEDGFKDTLEASVGYESSIYVVDDPEESDRYVTIGVER